jgi:hypothetical protein
MTIGEEDLISWHLENGTPDSRAMYARFVHMLDQIGPYTVHPARSTITFKGTRRGFCGAHPKGERLVGYFDLTRQVDADVRVRSVSPYTKRLFVHQFRVLTLSDLDNEFKNWLVEAYAVGQGKHLLQSIAS